MWSAWTPVERRPQSPLLCAKFSTFSNTSEAYPPRGNIVPGAPISAKAASRSAGVG